MKKHLLARMLETPKRTMGLLACVYVFAVLIRFLLARWVCMYPSVIIDEMLYTSIARSIATGNGLLFKGQPADYSFIIYPLVLAPVYALFGEGTDFYAVIQLWNSVLMTLSIFPLYHLAYALARDNRKAFLVVCTMLLMPDFILIGKAMSECILYPMFYTLAYFAYRFLADKKRAYALGVGVLGGLMFATKPGQFVPAAAVLGVCLVLAIKQKQKKDAVSVLLGASCMLFIFAAQYALVRYGFGHDVTLFSVYNMQIVSSQGLQLAAFAKGAFLSPFYFLISSCGLCCLLPITLYRKYDNVRRMLLFAMLIAIAITMLGMAWTINRVEYRDPTVHMRYVAMYIPVLLAFCLSPVREEAQAHKKKTIQIKAKPPVAAIIATAYTVICCVFFGCRAGYFQANNIISNFTVAIFKDSFMPPDADAVCSVIIALCALIVLFMLIKLKRESLQKAGVSSLVCLLLLNNIAAYDYYDKTNHKWLMNETALIRQIVRHEEYLYVYGTYKYVYNADLYVKDTKDTTMVFVNDLFNHMAASKGVYIPFVPDSQRGTLPAYLTPDTDLLVLDKIAYSHIKPSETVTVLTPGEHDMYVLRIPLGERWLDSMMGGVVNSELDQGVPCIISLYDDALRSVPVKLTFDLELPSASAVIVTQNNGEAHSFDFGAGRDSYTVTFSAPLDTINITVRDCDAKIYGYEISPAGT